MKRDAVPQFIAIAIPVAGNVLAVANWLPLLRVEAGATIRPMRESCYAILVAAITLAVGVPGGSSLIRKGQRFLGVVCLVGSVTPLMAGWLTAEIISGMRGLTWAP